MTTMACHGVVAHINRLASLQQWLRKGISTLPGCPIDLLAAPQQERATRRRHRRLQRCPLTTEHYIQSTARPAQAPFAWSAPDYSSPAPAADPVLRFALPVHRLVLTARQRRAGGRWAVAALQVATKQRPTGAPSV